jgi:hypothetical protein
MTTTRDRIIGLIVAVVTVILTLILLFVLEARSETRELCMDAEMRDRIRTLAMQGHDEAFKTQAAHLFSVYVLNPDEIPNRAQVGTQRSIRAYVRVRELALKWNPPSCTP